MAAPCYGGLTPILVVRTELLLVPCDSTAVLVASQYVAVRVCVASSNPVDKLKQPTKVTRFFLTVSLLPLSPLIQMHS